MIYIGQTGRNFLERKKKNILLYLHLIKKGHIFDKDYKILLIENKSQKLNLPEALEINKFKHSDIILNGQLDISNSPL